MCDLSYNYEHMSVTIPPIKCQGIKTKLIPLIINNVNTSNIDTWIEPFMEEIIGFGCFFRNNKQLFERYPKITAAYKDFSTEGFALAVYEEFIPFFGISLLAFFFPCKVLYALWLGLMIALTAHFLVHIGQSIYIRKYIP